MVVISKKSIEKLLRDVAPKVQMLSGWDPDLKGLNIKLIKRYQFWKYALKPKFDNFGIDTTPYTFFEKAVSYFIRNIVSRFPLGLYESSIDTILIMPENIPITVNQSGLTVALGHELHHRGQHINKPEFDKRYQELSKEICAEGIYKVKLDKKELEEKLQPLMTLMEGDASFVQSQLISMFYRDSSIMGPDSLRALFFRPFLPKMIKQKLEQYILGSQFVANEYQAGGRQKVNALYDLDLNDLKVRMDNYQSEKKQKNKK